MTQAIFFYASQDADAARRICDALRVGTSWMFSQIPRNLLLSERGKALELLREAATSLFIKTYSGNAMQIDPPMTPFRDDKEIMALLAGPKRVP